MLKSLNLNTVCRGAKCPNIFECYARKTATFMIMGNTCTRGCAFCAVGRGIPAPLDPDEPRRVAEAAKRLKLKFVVITSVTRDDLADGGAGHFIETIQTVRNATGAKIEVLTPDFKGDESAIRKVISARPNVFNHNIETVKRLYPAVRPAAEYERSLKLIETVAREGGEIIPKSGIMLGLGETEDEIAETLRDMKSRGCEALTIGQYLAPSEKHFPVAKYYTPDEFKIWEIRAREAGFQIVQSGPFVRSSYMAEQLAAGR
jgi:lipoic acid synthetase